MFDYSCGGLKNFFGLHSSFLEEYVLVQEPLHVQYGVPLRPSEPLQLLRRVHSQHLVLPVLRKSFATRVTLAAKPSLGFLGHTIEILRSIFFRLATVTLVPVYQDCWGLLLAFQGVVRVSEAGAQAEAFMGVKLDLRALVAANVEAQVGQVLLGHYIK